MTRAMNLYTDALTRRYDVLSEGPSFVQRAGRTLYTARRLFKTWRDARITARQLRRLDGRLLADLGLEPSDIDWVARDLAQRHG